MTRVLVAGGAGFLGSHLVEALLKKGYDITVVDDLSSGLESNISGIAKDVEFIKADIADFKYSGHFDVLVNLASRASRVEWETYPVEVALSNSLGNNNLIKIALKNKALYVYASSSEVYGDPDVIPTPESFVGKVSTTGSRSPYDEGKRFGEALIKAYEKEYGLRNIILRFFNTYGPRMRGGDFYGRVMDRFVQQAIKGYNLTVYGNGMQTRSFTYVTDSVNAMLLLIKRGKDGEIYNVGNNVEVTILDLARMILQVTKSPSRVAFLPLPSFDPSRRSADISKLRLLGFAHRVSLVKGIQMMVKNSLSNDI